MGMKNRGIYRIFWMISQLEAVLGVGVGIGLGLAAGYWFNGYLNQTLAQFLPVQDAQVVVEAGTLLQILVFVCVVCGVTSYFSARTATQIDVVDTLQSE